MNRHTHPVVTVALAIAALAASPADARAEGKELVLHFTMHATPGDPQSAVTLEVSVKVVEYDRSGNAIQWAVEWIEFRIPGDPDQVWADTTPRTAPEDLWWAEHADLDNPLASELADLPPLEGTADAVFGTTTDLLFSFDANAPANPNLYGGNVADATYSLALVTEPEEPISGGADEPTRIEDE